MTIREMNVGQIAVVRDVGGQGALRQHFLDMGLTPGVEVRKLKVAPMGDPVEIMLRGYSLTLRLAEAAHIEVEPVAAASHEPSAPSLNPDFGYNLSLHEDNSHPGFGESGKYHDKANENPLPKGTVLKFALVGQHNCGKTALFNQLTGSNLHVGNFPGVTVDRKDGEIRRHRDTLVTDLPGMYSLSPYTEKELVPRNYILNEKPNAIINVVDANNIERHMYLTVQLMELEIPMVLAVNMMDELRGNGGSVRINEMERELGIPVVPVSASKGEAIEELVDHAIHVAKYQEKPVRRDFCSREDGNGAVHRCLHGIMHLVEDHANSKGIPLRFAASRLVEGDQEVLSSLELDTDEQETLERIIKEMEKDTGMDRNAALADMRYRFIRKLCENTVVRPGESREHIRSNNIDKVLTGRWTAVPVFISILALIFWLTFDVIGGRLQNLLATGINSLSGLVAGAFERWDVSTTVRSLVIDALFGGVGIVISFIPIIIVLFFFLSMLEDSGYMARVAFVSDKLLRRIGLSGRSIVPMLIGFGCSVPGVMATRTLPSAIDRKRTIILIPFMSCSAKIAVYGFLANAFFPGRAALVMISLYLLGIAVGILCAFIGRKVNSDIEPAPFVMELPTYRLPMIGNVGHLLWEKTKDFLQTAFSVIFVATIVIWFLQSFDFSFNLVEESSDSILAWLAGLIAPVFNPLGFGDWRIVTSLISGFLAKESIVSTMEVLDATSVITSATAVPLLVFCLLYTPCVAAIASVKRELGARWAVFVMLFQCIVAWICAWIAYMIVLI